MVDFAKLLAQATARRRAGMSPEELEADLRVEAQQKKILETRRDIPAEFEVLSWKDLGEKKGSSRVPERSVDRRYTREIAMVIEPRDNGAREVLQFLGAVTGHEAFELTPDLCERLAADAGGRWSICAGTPHRYDSCSVAVSDVLDYLRELRPALFNDQVPAP